MLSQGSADCVQAAEASPAGSHSPSPGRRGVPKLVFATPGGSTFSPITPGGAAAASPASPELGDASDEDEVHLLHKSFICICMCKLIFSLMAVCGRRLQCYSHSG